MRHRVKGKKLGRRTDHREAMVNNLVSELFKRERITTTEAKAREVRGAAEKMITKAIINISSVCFLRLSLSKIRL